MNIYKERAIKRLFRDANKQPLSNEAKQLIKKAVSISDKRLKIMLKISDLEAQFKNLTRELNDLRRKINASKESEEILYEVFKSGFDLGAEDL